MYKENNRIIKIDINEKKVNILKKIEEYYDGMFELFFYILKKTRSNFYWECISITIQYTQLLIFIVDETVRKNIYKLVNIVFAYMVHAKYYN